MSRPTAPILRLLVLSLTFPFTLTFITLAPAAEIPAARLARGSLIRMPTAVPEFVKEMWEKKGPSLVLLRNRTR